MYRHLMPPNTQELLLEQPVVGSGAMHITPTSEHRAGSTVLLADGSVRFIADHVADDHLVGALRLARSGHDRRVHEGSQSGDPLASGARIEGVTPRRRSALSPREPAAVDESVRDRPQRRRLDWSHSHLRCPGRRVLNSQHSPRET